MTVGCPASGDEVISVGAYITRLCWDFAYSIDDPNNQCYNDGLLAYYDPFSVEGDLGYFSSRGPRRDGVITPNVSAPGVGIGASYSHMLDPANNYFYNSNRVLTDGEHAIMQGTSMASPHGTGMVALMLEKNPTLDFADVEGILQGTARSDTFTGAVPNDDWGYGKVDADDALAATPLEPIITELFFDSFEDPCGLCSWDAQSAWECKTQRAVDGTHSEPKSMAGLQMLP